MIQARIAVGVPINDDMPVVTAVVISACLRRASMMKQKEPGM